MFMIKKWVSLLLVLVVCVNFLPVAVAVQHVQASSTWTGSSVTGLPSNSTSDASVIYDSGTSTYKMWYTKGVSSYGPVDTQFAGIRAVAGTTLLADIQTLNFTNIKNNDAGSVKAVIHYLAGLSPSQLDTLSASVNP